MFIPESKWFGTYSLVLLPSDFVEKPRRPGLAVDAYVFRLAGGNDNGATKLPNHFVSGIQSNVCIK